MGMKCSTCEKKANHVMSYGEYDSDVMWTGDYCLDCFVKKLRGMALVFGNKNKKYCKKCKSELKDKRVKICDECRGNVFHQ